MELTPEELAALVKQFAPQPNNGKGRRRLEHSLAEARRRLQETLGLLVQADEDRSALRARVEALEAAQIAATELCDALQVEKAAQRRELEALHLSAAQWRDLANERERTIVDRDETIAELRTELRVHEAKAAAQPTPTPSPISSVRQDAVPTSPSFTQPSTASGSSGQRPFVERRVRDSPQA